MATSTTVHLNPGQQPEFRSRGITFEASRLVSDYLTKNHHDHHIFFNDLGFHNHIAHHLLTVWALSANADQVKVAHKNNLDYQRPPPAVKESDVRDMHDPEKLKTYMGDAKYYSDFLVFFHEEIDKLGWQQTLQKWLFSRTQQADDMLLRLFGAIIHPLLHLGFAVEFEQPPIVAETLAQTAVTTDELGGFFYPAEKAAEAYDGPEKPLIQIFEDIKADDVLRTCAKFDDDPRLERGVMDREMDRISKYLCQVRIKPEQIDFKLAELINLVAYYTGGAMREDREIKYDFFYIHNVNSNIFMAAILRQTWLSDENRVRLLLWKTWFDLASYVSQQSPEIRFDIVRKYEPKHPSGWDGVIKRANECPDDGHAAKLVRALAHGQQVCEPYEDREDFKVKKDDWLQMAHMAIDTEENNDTVWFRWVRGSGFDKAWDVVESRHKQA